MSVDPATLGFPKDDAEAASRFESYKYDDPFRGIVAPALLNSADIYDYARVTGMLHPFTHDEKEIDEKLKGASYEIDFLGDVYWSDDKGILRKQTIAENTVFQLRKNSIAFVRPSTTFRLPHYIAVRFNLRITYVHRGLLLGTGPLVDPGFVGHLLIPLHNLTSEDYALIGGEGFIWAEFTKISEFTNHQPRIRGDTQRRLFEFQSRKIDLDPQAYFNKASHGVPARSSIPGEVREARRIAQDTAKKVSRYTWGAIITGALTVFALIGATWSLISDANKNVADSSKNVTESRKSLDEANRELHKLRIDSVEKATTLSRELENLRARVDVMEKKVVKVTANPTGK